MRSLILVFFFWCFSGNTVKACICFQHPLDTALKYADAVFVGVLVQILQDDNLFEAEFGSRETVPHWNLKVLRINKGLSQYSDFVSVFDVSPRSSCRGFLCNFQLGDTILLFANYFGMPLKDSWHTLSPHTFLWGDLCSPHFKISCIQEKTGLGLELKQFLENAALWAAPEPGHIKPDLPMAPIRKASPENIVAFQLALLASLLLNLLLAVLLWRRNAKS